MEAKPTAGRKSADDGRTTGVAGGDAREDRRREQKKKVPERGEGIVGGETIPSLDPPRNGGGVPVIPAA
jgi:hypothetical protein